jgi:hypothetical protein
MEELDRFELRHFKFPFQLQSLFKDGKCQCPCGYLLDDCSVRYDDYDKDESKNEICYDLYDGGYECICKEGLNT